MITFGEQNRARKPHGKEQDMPTISENTARKVVTCVDALQDQLVAWRRDFHRFPELGFLEYRTTATIIEELRSCGYEVLTGQDATDPSARMGLPTQQEDEAAIARAIEEGADPDIVHAMAGGFTGAVAILKNGDGPVVGMRFDIDCLPLQETDAPTHLPAAGGFASTHPSAMHACGHDSHITMGLGVARAMAALTGTLKLLFQPAEEGVRGAQAMVSAGLVDDVEVMLGQHVWPHDFQDFDFAPGSGGALATTKFDVNFTGLASHASGSPEKGKNALLAACTATLNLYAISRHSGGSTRISVGKLEAGDTRNIVAEHAHFEMEVRGQTTEINEFMATRARTVIEAAAAMYECDVDIIRMGEAISLESDEKLMDTIAAAAEAVGVRPERSTPAMRFTAPEDYSYMMKRVQDNGGQAALILFFTPSEVGLHSVDFCVDESVLPKGVKTFVATALASMPK